MAGIVEAGLEAGLSEKRAHPWRGRGRFAGPVSAPTSRRDDFRSKGFPVAPLAPGRYGGEVIMQRKLPCLKLKQLTRAKGIGRFVMQRGVKSEAA